MKTTFKTTTELLETSESPLDIGVIPDKMGVSLRSVEGVSWTKQDDGQLVSLTIHFNPSEDTTDEQV